LASHVDAETTGALGALCQASGATLFMGLHAAFSVLLARYSNETDIVVGSPIANREQAEVAGLIGFFVNTLVLRSDLSGNPSFAGLLAQSKAMLLDAYAHQQVPFEQIVERLQPARSMSHGALFQVMLVMQNNEDGTLELPGLTVSPVEHDKAVARYDLRLNIIESVHGLSLEWDYNTDLFEEATIARMARHFSVLLGSLAAAPEASVFTVDMLPVAEHEALLAIAVEGDKAGVVTQPRLLHARVLEQIRASGDSVAVKTASRTLTYHELGVLSEKLAMRLVAQGALPNTLVGVVMEKGWEQVVAVLGILRSGAAYLPIDANLPEERIALLLKLGEVAQLVTTPKYVARLPADAGLSVIEIDADFEHGEGAGCASWTSTDRCGVDDLAYVIFTSGSTGAPKGVMIDHKGAANTVDDLCVRYGLGARDSVLGLSNLNFDLSVFDIFGLLAVGGKLVLPTSAEVNDPDAWLAYLRDEAVTIWNTVPAFMQILTQQEFEAHWQPALRLVLMSGDWIPTELPAKIAEKFPLARQISLGGATEASIWSISYPIDDVHAERRSIPYGKAMTGQHMYVLQRDMRPAPYGVSGDIYIGGIGVALGYWRDEQKTAANFLTHPERGVRLYKTGDLGCLRPDGNIEFLGRIDHQVKIRGFRIELGEIEHALASHPLVGDAVVLARDFAGSGKRLVAYVVANDAGIDLDDESEASLAAQRALVDDLRRHLGSSLADYMMPSACVLLASLPLSANGKVDRKALPEPDASQLQAAYVAPRTETERRLCTLWQEILGVERVGVTDNFFQLGGHSLLVMRLITELKSSFGADLPIKVFFQFADLQALAACLDVINPAPSSKHQPNDGRNSQEEMEVFQL
jgi:amino acid adenylation domain-containing protein